MENNTFEEIWDKIKSSEKILMSLHSGPDGDSLGCCTAMRYVLEKLGKDVRLISHDELSEHFMNMEFAKEIEFGEDIIDIELKDYDVLLCLDTSTEQMIGKFKANYSASLLSPYPKFCYK